MQLIQRCFAGGSLGILLLAGCGDGRPSLVPINGTVTLNGTPVEGAQLGFEPQEIEGYSRPSMAITDAQGKFTIGTYDKADGIPAGSYKVSVFKRDVVSKLPENFNSEDTASSVVPVTYKWAVPQKYSTTLDSGITVEISSSGMKPDTIALTGEAEVQTSGPAANAP
ncbi:MAG: hypothetical protein NT138_20790 [Planctomycetales bacterium]|nr:hypothetical protein [Planctomycetales bacterium]